MNFFLGSIFLLLLCVCVERGLYIYMYREERFLGRKASVLYPLLRALLLFFVLGPFHIFMASVCSKYSNPSTHTKGVPDSSYYISQRVNLITLVNSLTQQFIYTLMLGVENSLNCSNSIFITLLFM